MGCAPETFSASAATDDAVGDEHADSDPTTMVQEVASDVLGRKDVPEACPSLECAAEEGTIPQEKSYGGDGADCVSKNGESDGFEI